MEMKEKTERAKSMGRHAEKCWLRSKREIDIWAASLRRFIFFFFLLHAKDIAKHRQFIMVWNSLRCA
jgi:hypothetical protein